MTRYRAQAVAMAVTLVLVSGAILPLLGSEFIPRLEEGTMIVSSRQPPSVSLEQTIHNHTEIERVLRGFPEITKMVSRIGRPEVTTDPMSVDAADIYVNLKPPAEWQSAHTQAELIEKLQAALDEKVPGVAFSFSQPIEMRMSELIAGARSDIVVKLFGDDLNQLKKTGEQIAGIVGRVRGAEDVKVEQVSGLPQLQIKPDRAAIARYGINIEDVNDLVESVIAGKDAGLIYEGEQRFNLVVRLSDAAGKDVEQIKNLLVPAPNGARIPLSQLADVSVSEGPAQISRDDTRRRITVELNVRGRDIGSFVQEAQERIGKEVQIPPATTSRGAGRSRTSSGRRRAS